MKRKAERREAQPYRRQLLLFLSLRRYTIRDKFFCDDPTVEWQKKTTKNCQPPVRGGRDGGHSADAPEASLDGTWGRKPAFISASDVAIVLQHDCGSRLCPTAHTGAAQTHLSNAQVSCELHRPIHVLSFCLQRKHSSRHLTHTQTLKHRLW